MVFNIGMVGASGAGKTSLVTAMFKDMECKIRSWGRVTRSARIMGSDGKEREARFAVNLRYGDGETKNAIADASRRFTACIRGGRFFANWERSSSCSRFKIDIEFAVDDLARKFDFCIMDYPGGLLSDKGAFERECLAHIRKSCALIVPIDAVVLMAYWKKRAEDRNLADKILGRLEMARVVEIVREWCGTASGRGGVLMFVPVKTESYFDDNGCGVSREEELKAAVKELYADAIGGSVDLGKIKMVYNPVDTYGCVRLNEDDSGWVEDRQNFKEVFEICGERNLRITGALDLFTVVVKSQLDVCREKTESQMAEAREKISSRGAVEQFIRRVIPIIPDPTRDALRETQTAADFYNAALKEMADFSSTRRIEQFN